MLEGKQRSVFGNVFWAALGKVVNMLSSLFVGVLVARYLGPDDFGAMAFSVTFVFVFSIIASFGLDSVEIRELSACEESLGVILGTSFVIRLLASCFAVVSLMLLLFLGDYGGRCSLLIVVFSLSLPMSAFNVIKSYFSSAMRNDYVVKAEIVRTVLSALLKVGLVLCHADLFWFVYAVTLDCLVLAFGYISLLVKYGGGFGGWRFSLVWFKKLLQESYPLLISGTIVILYQRLDQLIIKGMLDSVSLGNYASANRILDVGLFLPVVICQSMLPLLVRVKRDMPDEFAMYRQYFLDVMTWLSVFMSVGLSFGAVWLVPMLFGKEYMGAVCVLTVLSWKIVFYSMFNSVGSIILIDGLQKWAYVRNFMALFVSLTMNVVLIPRYGVVGSAYSALLTGIMAGVVSHLIVADYRKYFVMQMRSLVFGVRSLVDIKMHKKMI